MVAETKSTRRVIMASGSPFISHSLNQSMMRKILEGERRVLGKPKSKIERAERRRQRIQEQLARQIQPNIVQESMQDETYFSGEALYAEKIPDDRERANGNNGCEVTIVDLTRTSL